MEGVSRNFLNSITAMFSQVKRAERQ